MTEAKKKNNKFDFRGLLIETGTQLLNYLIILSISLLIGALVIFLSGKDPVAAYAALWKGAFGNRLKIADTLDRTTIMILAGIAGAVAFRTNVINLGLEGQLYIGAFSAALVGFGLTGVPSYIHIPLCLIAGLIGGALWTIPVIYLKMRWNITELVTTLMMNYIGIRFTEYLIAFPFRDPEARMAGSPLLEASARLPKLIQGSTLNIGFIMAIVIAIGMYWFLFGSKTGFEMRMVGLNKDFAAAAGIPVNRSYTLAMMMSGAIVGLGGAIMVMGFFGRFLGGFSSGYGWDGMMIALLAQNHPLGVLPASLFYGALANGALAMQSATGVPQSVVVMVKGSVVFFVTVTVFVNYIKRRLEKWAA
jgi:ABC-type uncharacterized transport system permease subunit